MRKLIILLSLLTLLATIGSAEGCQPCYDPSEQNNCQPDPFNISAYTLHMSVHPHLDAFWIFDFQSYYNPQPNQGHVRSYFASNRFHSVKQIFDTTLEVLSKSRKVRETEGPANQKAHRSFFNSEMGFFKRWYFEQSNQKRQSVRQLLRTKYWEIVGGGYVEHDEGCAYYDDIIQNFQLGLHFLKEQIGYYPRAAISADSFGHSQSTLAILAHLGVEGFFVERSDEHILLQNKTQFIWKAKSANGKYYGALPTHIRWAIHGFEDQFIGSGMSPEHICQSKAPYIGNMNRENQFLKRILKSNHIMRYFGHDFQQFDDYSYNVIEGFMEKFSMQKCKKVNAVYSNPTEYFLILMGQVFGKTKPIATREEDIMPIWDYDSGLYWTGYYTTDPYHKKMYRDAGRLLYAARKAFTPAYVSEPNSPEHTDSYRLLEQYSETVSYLQHHDGISGTSKYEVMDKYEKIAQDQAQKIKKTVLQQMFETQFPANTNNPVFECSLSSECQVPKNINSDLYLKVYRTGGDRTTQPIIVHLQANQYFEPDCAYEIICLCTGYPCPCDLYLYPQLGTYTLIHLKAAQNAPKDPYLLRELKKTESDVLKFNQTHLSITHKQKQYKIGYKRLDGDPTSRTYAHLSRYGDQVTRAFSIRSGKYALGNNLKTEVNLSKIRKVLKLQSDYLTKYIVIWAREQMKTVITISKSKLNQWKIETISSAESGKLKDLYLEVSAPLMENNKRFYTDSNGWLVMKRELFKHEDYQAHFGPEGYDDVDGNSYPITSFVYIQDEAGSKLSVNTDRPQGVISPKPGTIWINYDRLSSDDGKWVYENTFRSEYQKFVHYITAENSDNNERKIQKLYDEPLIIQGNAVGGSQRVVTGETGPSEERRKWEEKVGLDKVKFQIKPWNDSTLLLRVFNMRDNDNVTIELFSGDKVCTFLTAYYGNQVEFGEVYETNLAGNIKYEQFMAKKWNWNKIVNLQKQNEIFNKQFGETIVLRPLQIRTFVLENVKIKSECRNIASLKYTQRRQVYQLNTSKEMPGRTAKDKENELRITNYLLNENHCIRKSPVNDPSLILTQPNNAQDEPDIPAQSHILPLSKKIQPLKPVPEPKPKAEEPKPAENPNPTPHPTPHPTSHPSPHPAENPAENPTESQAGVRVDKDEKVREWAADVGEKIRKRERLSREEKQLYFNKLLERVRASLIEAETS